MSKLRSRGVAAYLGPCLLLFPHTSLLVRHDYIMDAGLKLVSFCPKPAGEGPGKKAGEGGVFLPFLLNHTCWTLQKCLQLEGRKSSPTLSSYKK